LPLVHRAPRSTERGSRCISRTNHMITKYEQKLSQRPDFNHMAHILDEHGVARRVKAGKLLAESVSVGDGQVFRTWVNVSNWSFRQLYAWLGY
jgi:hypothetical protein